MPVLSYDARCPCLSDTPPDSELANLPGVPNVKRLCNEFRIQWLDSWQMALAQDPSINPSFPPFQIISVPVMDSKLINTSLSTTLETVKIEKNVATFQQ